MDARRPAKPGSIPRDIALALALVSHLLVTFGFPLPAVARKAKDASRPFPCQNRPCGCLTAEQCWAGDCCCLTLEEKVTWAEDNGVEPPDHARQKVESRKSPPAPKAICCRDEAEAGSDSLCCQTRKSDCCQKGHPVPVEAGPRWVVGIFAQRCRGEGPAGLFQLPPATVSDASIGWLADQPAVETVLDLPRGLTSTGHSPPIPPPRRG